MSDWHPILAAVEQEPGVWFMVDPRGRRQAIVRLLRRGDELGYRAVTWADRSEDRGLIGYCRSFHGATTAGHMRLIAGHRVGGSVNGR